MDNLLREAEVRKLLTLNGDMTISKESFSDLIKGGKIPIADKIGKKNRKMFVYEDVQEALILGGYGKPKSLEPTTPPNDDDVELDDEELSDVYERFKLKPTLTDANIIKTIVSTKRDQIKLDEEQGLLISRAEVEDKAFIISRSIRDKILTIPERLSSELASMSDPYAVKEALYKEFGILLEGFSKDSFL